MEKRPKISKKYRKIALFSLFEGAGNGKKTENSKKGRKIALLGLYLLYLYHVWKSRGGGARPTSAPRCRRPCAWRGM